MMIIYETRNLVNGKVYRGQHICGVKCQTRCEYLGSGTSLKRAIEKYGRHNFRRRILAYATYPSVLNDLEKIYVTDDFVARQDTYNQMTGGGSSGIPGAETRAKIGVAKKGRKLSPEHKAATSAAMKDKPKSEAHKAAMSASMTPERREKISERHKGKQKSEAHKAAMSASMTPERREKISERHKGKQKSEAHKAAMSASMTPERRALQSANQKKVWAERKAAQANQEKYQSKLF